MKANISTILHADHNRMWHELQKTGSLIKVASPILTFRTRDGKPLPATWEVGKSYALDLFAWAFAHFFYRHRQRRWKALLAQ